MIPIITLLLVISLSMLVTKIATIALVHTGMSEDGARLQAISGFTGTGFTTEEAENITAHPVRRRILIILMILGNAGLVTAVASMIGGFMTTHDTRTGLINAVTLFFGIGILASLAASRWFNRALGHFISWCLKRLTDIHVADFSSLLHISEKYMVAELTISGDMWVSRKTLQEARLAQKGLIVLGIEKRDGSYVGAPHGQSLVSEGDKLIVYGQNELIQSVCERGKQHPFRDLEPL